MKLETTIVACALLLALPTTSAAHPYHVSNAQAEVDAKRGALEVALEVDADTLERALSRRSKAPLQLESCDRDRLDKLAAGYLRAVFKVSERSPGGLEQRPLRFVGLELEGRVAWLYFEFPLSATQPPLELSNSAFFELEARQRNGILLTRDGRRESLVFIRGRDGEAVRLTTPPKETSRRSPR
jgi:hypothetical protein